MAFLGAGLGAFDNLSNFALDVLGFGPDFVGPAGTSIVIQELEGEAQRRIVLRGRAMPYRGVGWEGEQKTKKTNYPGNPVATLQILGPIELPTTMDGMWKDRFIRGSILVGDGNGPDDGDLIDTAEKAVRFFEDLARAGRLLRVQWMGVVRTGILRRFLATFDRITDTKWECEWEWISRNDDAAPRAAEVPEVSSDSLLDLLNKIEDILTLAPDLAAAFTASILDTIEAIREKCSLVVGLLRVVETVVGLPAAVMGALKAAVGELVREVQELVRRCSDRASASAAAVELAGATVTAAVPGTIGLTLGPGGVSTEAAVKPSSSVAQTAAFGAYTRNLSASADALGFAAQRALQATVDRQQPPTVQRVVVGEGETLYTLSVRFFGTPDFATFLAATNGLQTAAVPAGFELRIPPRPASAAGPVELYGSPTGAFRGQPRCDPVTGECLEC